MYDCKSSLIARYGYDPKKLEMAVDFHNGGVYLYKGVVQQRFEEFIRASSKGKFFLSNIKGKYETEKQ
jgi:hypothetical protein